MNILNTRHWGFGLAIIGTGLFSLKSIIIKLLYLQGLQAGEVLVWRMALAVPFYLGMLLWLNLRPPAEDAPKTSLTLTDFLLILGLGFLGYYLASWLDLMSLELISAQLERLVLFTYPFMVAILGFLFFKQALTWRLGFSLLITYAGIWIVMGQELKLTGNAVILGTSLVLGAALSFSLYVLFAKAWIHRLGSLHFTSLAMTASSVIVFVHGAVFLPLEWAHITALAWFWLLMLAVVSTVIPSFMMTEAIACIGPAQTGVIGTLGPIFTMLLAILWLQEPFDGLMGLGALMVIMGVGVLMTPVKS